MLDIREFRLEVVPRGQGRPRVRSAYAHQNGMTRQFVTVYKAKEDKDYEKLVLDAYNLKYRRAEPMKNSVYVSLVFYLPVPKAESKKTRTLMLDGTIDPTKKPDLDNLVKAVLDGLNGQAWEDDRQIVSLEAEKKYSETPGIIVRITGVGENEKSL